MAPARAVEEVCPGMQTLPTNHSIHPDQNKQSDSTNSLGTIQIVRLPSSRFNGLQLSSCFLGLVALGSSIVLAGCGGIKANTNAQSGNGSGGSTGSLSVSPSTLPFGSVALGSSATAQVTLTNSSSSSVTISNVALNSSTFTVDGMGTLPATIAANSSATLNVHFSPSAAGSASAQLVVTDNTLTTPSLTIQLQGTGAQSVPALASVSCTSSSINSGGTDSCTATLASAAPYGGVIVDLSSNNAALKVPLAVIIPSNAASVGFTATAGTVSSSQSATLTADASSVDQTFALTVNPAGSASGAVLSIGATSIAFGNVPLNIPATQSVTLKSTGTTTVTVSSAAASGTGFTVSGATFPLTLNPNQSATLSVQFDPTATGADTGKLTIVSNSSSNSNAVVSLSGTGVPTAVDLSWNTPSGATDTIAGYNIYRATGSSSSFQKLNSSVNSSDSFMDGSVQSSTTYQYYVTSVDSSGAESTPSNTATVAIP
jgi:hypothetical protein